MHPAPRGPAVNPIKSVRHLDAEPIRKLTPEDRLDLPSRKEIGGFEPRRRVVPPNNVSWRASPWQQTWYHHRPIMPFLAEEHFPIPTKDILSWYFDDISYDQDQPVSVRQVISTWEQLG